MTGPVTTRAPLVVEHRGGTAVIRLTMPDTRNALGLALITALEQALLRVDATESVRAVVLTGDSGYFCAGADLRMIADRMDGAYELFRTHDRLVGLAASLERLRVPVIAAINGPALGGGAELCLACDIRLMEESATLSFPEVRLGIMPGAGGTARLPRIIGREKALYYELTGDPISASDAQAMGLVLRAVPDGDALARALELAARIGASAPAAVEFIKRSVRTSLDMPLEAAVDHCQSTALLLAGTSQAREGVAAFLAGRHPSPRSRGAQ